jgi:hypothetical protein
VTVLLRPEQFADALTDRLASVAEVLPAPRKASAYFYFINDATPVPINFHGDFDGRWQAITREVADQLGCDAEDLSVTDAYWGDDGYAELIVVKGRVVGSIDSPVSSEDLRQIEAES